REPEERRMNIITMTLVDASTASKLRDAIDSATFADYHLVLDTSPDKPEVRSTVEAMDDPTITLRSWAWQDDFSAARNQLLLEASVMGDRDNLECVWGVVLDSDERFVCNDPEAARAELQAWCGSATTTGTVFDVDEGYAKERVFRLPTKAHYVGPTHEAPIDTGQQGMLRTWTFWEL